MGEVDGLKLAAVHSPVLYKEDINTRKLNTGVLLVWVIFLRVSRGAMGF